MTDVSKFDVLRDMEKFTDEMFNRIISFQEKEHAAWDEAKPFAERIKGLPLHYLVFSNGDRDPQRFGPTIAPYYPIRREILRYVDLVKSVSPQAVVADVYPGNGFIGSLIGTEGLHVIGYRGGVQKPNQIESFYDPDHYQWADNTYMEDRRNVDVAFCSWMPSGVNDTPSIVKRQPKMIIFVYTEHRDDQNVPQTGGDNSFTDIDERYTLLDSWSTTRAKDLFHEVWPDLTPSPEEIRHTRIYVNADINIALPPDRACQGYDWETDLSMANLAHEAKQLLKKRGFPV